MKELIEFLVKGIAQTEDFEVSESVEDGRKQFIIYANSDHIGKIIGKGGKTIKTIRNLLKVRATLEKTGVGLAVSEKSD